MKDNTAGLREYAAMMIKTMTKALDVSPYTSGPDGPALKVRFWATLATMAQSKCGLAKAASGADALGGLVSTGYMTRKEAAAYLRISLRQLSTLPLPRTILGSRPRYSRADLDEYLTRRKTEPGRAARENKILSTDGERFIRQQKLKLQRLQNKYTYMKQPKPTPKPKLSLEERTLLEKQEIEGSKLPEAYKRYRLHNGRWPGPQAVTVYDRTGKWPREDEWPNDEPPVPGAKRDRYGALYWHTRGPSIYLSPIKKAKAK